MTISESRQEQRLARRLLKSWRASSHPAGLALSPSPEQVIPALYSVHTIGSHTREPVSLDLKDPNAHSAPCCDFSPGVGVTSLLGHSEPPAYSLTYKKLGAIYKPEVMDTIEKKINELGPALRSLSLQIHSHPELMFEERFAHDKLTKFMSSHGFTVTKHYLGLETAWRAEWSYGKGGRILGVNSEMDALPGIGHACGHNLIAIAGVGIAIAVKAALKKHNVPGKVVLLGTPAEEGGTGKIILLERGGYKDMAACIMCHPTIGPVPNQWAGVKSSLSVQSIEAEYFGHTAHASAAPWEGTNALDAAFLAYTNISALRQQMKPDHRVHGVITGKDTMAANVIPDYTKMTWLVRAPSWKEVEVLRERVLACLQAASLATACKMKITLGKGMYDLRHTPVLADEFAKTMGERYGWVTDFGKNERGASTDFGNITYAMPALHPVFAIPTKPLQGNHTPGFTAAAASEGAHSATLTMVKALALVGFRVLDDEEYFRKVRKSFEEMF